MTEETYRCSGCKKNRKAPKDQDITRCRICGTISEKVDGVWLQSSGYSRKSNTKSTDINANWVGFLIAVIFGLLGYFLVVPVTQTTWGSNLLNYSGLFLFSAGFLITCAFSLLMIFVFKKKHSLIVLGCLTLFCISAITKLCFVDNKIPVVKSEIQSNQSISEKNLIQYSESELLNVGDLLYTIITDSEKLDSIENDQNLIVSKTLDEEEKNYDYVTAPADTNTPFPKTFRLSLNNQIETNLQNEYYVEASAGLGMRIQSKADANFIKTSIEDRFKNDLDLFESSNTKQNGVWFSEKKGNYYWVRFLTLESDFMILEIVRYMTDAEARQHKKVMENTVDLKGVADKQLKPLSPQEALACKDQANKLAKEKSALVQLEKRLAYLDFGDVRSEEHISKTQEYERRNSQYQTELEKYEAGCKSSVTISFETYSAICKQNDISNSQNPAIQKNRFCNAFPDYASKLNESNK